MEREIQRELDSPGVILKSLVLMKRTNSSNKIIKAKVLIMSAHVAAKLLQPQFPEGSLLPLLWSTRKERERSDGLRVVCTDYLETTKCSTTVK